jgi:undecaprenyl-diphosphatase
MNLIQTIILGVIQGITEWLPISSTGHLRVIEHLLGLQLPIAFDGLLHIGTIVVTIVFFKKYIKEILTALWRREFKTENGKIIPLIIVATVPTVVIGLLLGDMIAATFSELLPIAGAFAVCGIVLYASKLGRETSNSPSYIEALAIGTAQGIAIIPGLSRSGLTISAALLLGLKREKAFPFSFVLSIPAILGAVGLTLYSEGGDLVASGVEFAEILVGVAVSMAVGYFVLKLLRRILVVKKFHFFALYCWLFAMILVALSLSGF